jgi:hypothetical protein
MFEDYETILLFVLVVSAAITLAAITSSHFNYQKGSENGKEEDNSNIK